MQQTPSGPWAGLGTAGSSRCGGHTRWEDTGRCASRAQPLPSGSVCIPRCANPFRRRRGPPALHPRPLQDLLVPGAVGQPGAVTAAQRCWGGSCRPSPGFGSLRKDALGLDLAFCSRLTALTRRSEMPLIRVRATRCWCFLIWSVACLAGKIKFIKWPDFS